MFSYKLGPWFKKGDAPPSKTCKFDSIDGEAHSNVSGFSDRTLNVTSRFFPTSKTTLNQPCGSDRTIFHQADILVGARRIDLGKSTLTFELRNVRYANYSPVYHSISSFDRTFKMTCSIRDIQRQATIKG